MKRADREKKVAAMMIAMYCRRFHGGKSLCRSCEELLSYVSERIDHCPQGDAKTTCQHCHIHCYSPHRREQIRAVMRYSGPRMILHHPIEAIRHIIYQMRASRR